MRAKAKGKGHAEQGAGDQGMMFGYACNETPELMPAPIMFAHRLGRELTRIRKSGKARLAAPRREVAGLGDLRRRQAGRHFERGHLHAARRGREAHARSRISASRKSSGKCCPTEMLNDETEFLINPTGRFVVGGPQGDTGLTGARSSSIATAAWAVTAAAHSPARIRARSIAAPPTWAAGWRRTSSPPASRSAAKSSSPTPSAIPIR